MYIKQTCAGDYVMQKMCKNGKYKIYNHQTQNAI